MLFIEKSDYSHSTAQKLSRLFPSKRDQFITIFHSFSLAFSLSFALKFKIKFQFKITKFQHFKSKTKRRKIKKKRYFSIHSPYVLFNCLFHRFFFFFCFFFALFIHAFRRFFSLFFCGFCGIFSSFILLLFLVKFVVPCILSLAKILLFHRQFKLCFTTFCSCSNHFQIISIYRNK